MANTPSHNAFSPRKKANGETNWHKVGVAWPQQNKENSFTLQLDSLPLPDENGRVSVMLFPYEGETAGRAYERQRQDAPDKPKGGSFFSEEDLDDDVPF